jgi:hypothetical protein
MKRALESGNSAPKQNAGTIIMKRLTVHIRKRSRAGWPIDNP